jgi:hypothetical protein
MKMEAKLNISTILLSVEASLTFVAPLAHAENYRRLKTAQIRPRLAAMEVTDGVHRADQYMRDSTFKAFHMGKQSNGKWLVRNDELCLEQGPAPTSCKQVWAAGNRIEFRSPGSELPSFEGVLQKQQVRR